MHRAAVKCSDFSYEPTPSVFIPSRLVQVLSETVSSVASNWTYSGGDIRRLDKNKDLQILAVSLSVCLAQSFRQSRKYYDEINPQMKVISLSVWTATLHKLCGSSNWVRVLESLLLVRSAAESVFRDGKTSAPCCAQVGLNWSSITLMAKERAN